MTGRSLARFALAGTAARLAYSALRSRPPGGTSRWDRRNHRDEPVTLLEGPAVAAAASAAALAAPGLPVRQRLALAVAGVGAGAFGCYDDLAGSGGRRGLRGHLGALAKGEVTTGAVKIIGIGATGLTAGLLLGRPEARSAGCRVVDVVIDTGLVAGTANLINLFDLRPGRAIKVGLLTGVGLAATGAKGAGAAAAPVGAAVALLPEDLGERAMLGDAGANAVGAMLGVGLAAALPRPARLVALAGIAGLTLASEKISFTKVIAATPALNWLDQLGRRPPAAPSVPAGLSVPAAPSVPAGPSVPAATGPATTAPEAATSDEPAPARR